MYNITYWGGSNHHGNSSTLLKGALGQRLPDKSSIKPFIRKAEGLLQFASIGFRAIPGRWSHVVKKLIACLLGMTVQYKTGAESEASGE